MIKSIIVEDDPNYSRKLIQLLEKVEPPVRVLHVAANIAEALGALHEFEPQLVFLDIELGNESGFDFLKKIDKINFDVIFTTAHIDKNISDIRACALSYIPKPVILSELEDAIKKFIDKQNKAIGGDMVKALKSNMEVVRVEDKVIWINDSVGDYIPIDVRNILYCVSQNQYTTFFIKAGKDGQSKWVSTKGIGEWEADLEKFGFCRIHNRHLINLKYVVKYMKGEGAVKMSNGESLVVANERRMRFLKLSGIK